jgi:uncharacterized RmlC-like cupin family protein
MEKRNLGSLRVSVGGLGCNNFGIRLDEDRTRAVVHAALDAGIDFFDTADAYGAMRNAELESVIYVVRGRVRMRWGEALQFTAEAGPGDFIYVPPFVPHQEMNASGEERLECVVVLERAGSDCRQSRHCQCGAPRRRTLGGRRASEALNGCAHRRSRVLPLATPGCVY